MHRISLLLLSLATTTMVAGCGGLGTVQVEGTVTVDDKPLEGVVVLFKPTSTDGMPASGVTDASGKFKLTTEVNGDGALPGEYKVGISKYETTGPDVPEEVDPDDPDSMDAIYGALDKQGRESKAKSLVAARFNSPETSGLTATVSENPEENKFEFATSKK